MRDLLHMRLVNLMAGALGLLVLFAPGCTTTEEPEPTRLTTVPGLGTVFDDTGRNELDAALNKPIVATELRADAMGSTKLPIRKAGAPVGGPPKEYSLAASRTRDIDKPDEKIDVLLNGDSLEIDLLVDQFKELLQFQYFLDPAVKGTVSITLDTQMTRAEAWELFEYLLWTVGAYASEKNGFLEVLPFAKMPKDRRLFATHDPISNVTVEMIRLYHLTPAEVITQIQPFMTEGATTTAIAHLNSVLIVEAPANMAKIRELVRQLDVLGETAWPVISIACRHADAETILDEINRIMPVIGYGVATDKSDGKSTKLIALPRHQILVASAPVPEILEEIQRWVASLDVESANEEESIFFYPVQYNTAEELADSVSYFFTDAQTSFTSADNSGSTGAGTSAGVGSNRSSGSSRTRSNSTNRNSSSTTARSQTQTQVRSPTAPGTTGTAGSARNTNDSVVPTTVFDIPVTLHADGPHNRIIVRTSARAYAMLEALLRRLDTPPLQVLIQTSIAEINLTKNTEFGFRYHFDKQLAIDNNSAGFVNALGDVSDTFALTLAQSPNEVFATIRAAAGKGNTRIVSEPQVIAISDHEAVINVGDSVPIITEFSGSLDSDSTSGNTTRNSVQYQDTGTILTVTPHITAKKLVTLDIRQEVSQAVQTAVSTINSPTIQTRTLETSLVIEDGNTVVLGGMISSSREKSRAGVPFLMDIPAVGKLFSTNKNKDGRTELLVLITVKVIDVKTDFEKFLKRYKTAVDAINSEHAEDAK